jgi:Cu/Ag efflux protein CusF
MASQVFVVWLLAASAGMPAQDPAAPAATVRDVAVVTGRIDRIDPFSRSVVLRTTEGMPYSVFVGPELKIFDELKAGDNVIVRITESVVVALRPNAKTTVVEDHTKAANKDGDGAADVMQQLKATVTVESVDAATQMITYKGADNRRVTRMVADRRLIEGLKPGDTIEITYTRQRAVELTKQSKNNP